MKKFLKKNPHWALCLASSFVALFYWSFIATDRYVSEASIVLQSSEISPAGFSVSSLLSGTSGAGDLLLLKEHLHSVDILQKLDKELDLRSHYSNPDIDFISRLSDPKIETEKFFSYMESRISVTFDDYAKVLRIKTQAYDPDMAQKITHLLMREGEAHMNNMGQRLASEQLEFIEQQAKVLEERLHNAREKLLAYQNEQGLVSPTGTVQSIASIVAQLEAQLALTQARKTSLGSYLSPHSAEMFRVEGEIAALKQQIELEKQRTATTEGNALNRISSEYQTLELTAQFSLQLYSNALLALEATRVESARKLKQVSVLQNPTFPEFSTEPRRIHNSLVFLFFALFLTAIAHLARAIIRDHRD